MITLIAKFTGKTSLGFISGREYELTIDCKFNEIDIESRIGLSLIYGGEEILRCSYSSISNFLKNWEILSINMIDSTSKYMIRTPSSIPNGLHKPDFNSIAGKIRMNMRNNKLGKILDEIDSLI